MLDQRRTEGNLTIKYSSYLPLDNDAVNKLVQVRLLAVNMVQAAVLYFKLFGRALETFPDGNGPDVQALKRHLRDPFANWKTTPAGVARAEAARVRLCQYLDSIHINLSRDLTISDWRAKLLRQFVDENGPRLAQLLKPNYQADARKGDNNTKPAKRYQVIKGLVDRAEYYSDTEQAEVWKFNAWLKAKLQVSEWTNQTRGDTVFKYTQAMANLLKEFRAGDPATLFNESFGWNRPNEGKDDALRIRNIRLNFDMLSGITAPAKVKIAAMLIHEASHKFCLTYDFAYSHQPAYKTLTVGQALNNADSLAMFCLCHYKQKCYDEMDDVWFD
jgi:hypothetical protein